MKAFLIIGSSLVLCLYSAQSLDLKKQQPALTPISNWDDTLLYGPQLPGYYSNKVSEYVRRAFQDSRGNLWFGTNSDGLAKHDGKGLAYINMEQGLSASQVTGIMEEKNGNIWFSTSDGITRYTPSETNPKIRVFRTEDGLCDASTWSIFQDSKGTIWAGTFKGLCRFNGKNFETVPIPHAEKSWVRAITEDRKGNLWIATSDHGAFKFDGKTMQQFSTKDGLCSNDLTCILEDSKGFIWFSSMDGGVSKYTGNTFTNFTAEKEIGDNEVWTIYEDQAGNIWFPSEGFGVYCYKDGKLTNFGEKEGFYMKAVQTIYQDRGERLWFGGGNGLWLYFGGKFTPVTKDGPWEIGC